MSCLTPPLEALDKKYLAALPINPTKKPTFKFLSLAEVIYGAVFRKASVSNFTNEFKQNLLHAAAILKADLHIIQFLIECGFSSGKKDIFGNSLFDYAMSLDCNEKVIELLKSHIAPSHCHQMR